MKTHLKHNALAILVALLANGFALTAFAADSTPSVFERILEKYETVRLALTQDSLEGVPEQGKEIQAILESLASDWSPAAACVEVDKAQDVHGLLPKLSEAASALARATSLDAARDAFYELSMPLVRWRKAAIGELPTVAFCPMARRSWLQPKGELGNPYHGRSMLRCGEIVDG